MSLRKSSRSRNGSKSDVLPKPNARRRWTPAPSRVGLDLMSRLTGRIDIWVIPSLARRIILGRRILGKMDLIEHFRMLARYNRVANERLYEHCARLDDVE